MIGGADETEPEAQPSTRTATAPSPPSPPIAPPSSPIQGTGLGRRLLGSIRAFALPTPPPAAAPKVGLGLLLHVSPDHPLLHPATPSASPSPSASEDPLEEDAAAARPHADDAEPRSPLSRNRIADAAAASAPTNTMFRPTHVASPSKDESIATDVSSASEEDDPVEDVSERRHAAHAEPLSPVSRYRPIDPAARRAPANTMLTQWASKMAPHLLQHLMPAADTDGDEESGLVDGQKGEEFRAGDESRPTHVASPSEDEEDESIATDASEEDDPLEDSAERPHAADPELLSPVNRYRLIDRAAKRAPANTMFSQWASKAAPHLLQHLRLDTGGDLALEDHDAAAGDDQEEKVLQQCTGDQLRAARDDQEVVQLGATHPRDETTYDIAAENQEKVGVGSADNVDAVEGQEFVEQDAIDRKGEGTDGTAADDQDKAVKQCDTYGLGTGENGDAQDGREAVEQCVVDKEGAAMDDNAVKDHEMAGPTVVDGMHATIDDISADDLEKKVEQYATYDSIENDNAVEDQEVVQQGAIHPRDETTYAIAAEEQEKVGSAENVNVAEGQELVEQDAIDRKGQGTDGTAAEGQDKAVEQCGSYGLGTTENGDAENDQEAVEQCVIGKEGAAMDDNAVKDHEVAGPTEGTDSTHSVVNDISAEDQEKKVEQYATYDLETIENDDVMEDQEMVEQEIVFREGLTIDHDDSVEDHNVVDQCIIERMPASTDDIFVEDQKEVVEQCAVHEPRATKDEYTVKEKEKVVEQRVIDKQGASNMDVAAKNQDKLMKEHIIDNQGTVPMDDIAVKDRGKAAAQYASDVIITYRNDNPVEEHNKVGNQGVIDENDRTKDDIYVEEHDYLKEEVIVDNWGTFSDATALEDQKNEAEQCKGDEQIVGKDMYAVHMKGSMLEQRTGGKKGATKSDFTVEKYKDVVECVCHEWGAPDDDLAMDTAASQSIREISSSEVVSATANGSDGGIGKEKVKLPIRYPQRPGKLNCRFYMSSGSCSYGFSCQFHHPPLKAKPDGSWCPSEQGNHGVAETLELNRIGLPIRRGARNCTYYMRNGACRYGKHCHFNHPEHVIDAQFYTPTGWEDNALQLEKSSDQTTLDDTSHLKKSSDHTTLGGTSYSKKSSDHATLDGTSYSKKSSDHATLDDTSSSSEILPPNILRMLLPSQKVLPSTEVKVKKDSDWPSTSDDSDGYCSADSSDGPLCKQEHVDYPEWPGRPECPFYMRFGDCKFASACKYHHSKDKYPTRYHPKVPSLGGEQREYPERPGEPECPFYMKNRFCKFGAQCRFNHPKDSSPTMQNPTNAKKSVASNEHHQSTTTTLEDHMPQQQQYPERPGQPDCRYYLQFGECKFLSACIFNHPRDELPVGWNPSGPAHSDQIEPETHGMPECSFYMRSGKCQFGSACEFRHPKDICSTTEGAFGHRTDLADDTSTRPENVVQKQEQAMYPERPGEPRCFDYMNHGSCRRQMNCKYHHPADRLSRKQYDSTYH
ncbi:hypothetical protein ACQ4PT_002790 [Festuca glaucescens]